MFGDGKSYCSSFDTDCSIHVTMHYSQPANPTQPKIYAIHLLFGYCACVSVVCCVRWVLYYALMCITRINNVHSICTHNAAHKSLNWLCLLVHPNFSVVASFTSDTPVAFLFLFRFKNVLPLCLASAFVRINYAVIQQMRRKRNSFIKIKTLAHIRMHIAQTLSLIHSVRNEK